METVKNETKEGSLGNAVRLTPQINWMNMPEGIELRNLAVFVGQNGVGKTLVLVIQWTMTMIANGIIANKATGAQTSITEFAQYIFDNSFSDQNIDGTIKMEYESGAEIIVTLKEGKVQNVEYAGMEGLTSPKKPIFMSSNMRLFSAISMYLKLRKAKELEFPLSIPMMVREGFKVYDVMYIEDLIQRCPVKIDEKLRDALSSMMEDEIKDVTEFNVDIEKSDFYVVKGDQRKYMCSYGNGHQSLYNMAVGSRL